MKTTTKATASAASQIEVIEVATKYNVRVKVAKKDLTSISRLFNSLLNVYGDCLIGAKFADFKKYIKGRYNIAEDDKATEPKRGWGSAFHYAVQFAEKYISSASKDKNSPAYSAACAYLRSAKCEKQNAQIFNY